MNLACRSAVLSEWHDLGTGLGCILSHHSDRLECIPWDVLGGKWSTGLFMEVRVKWKRAWKWSLRLCSLEVKSESGVLLFYSLSCHIKSIFQVFQVNFFNPPRKVGPLSRDCVMPWTEPASSGWIKMSWSLEKHLVRQQFWNADGLRVPPATSLQFRLQLAPASGTISGSYLGLCVELSILRIV